MTRWHPILAVLILLLAGSSVAGAQPPDSETDAYRANADMQLALEFQAITAGGLSRGLSLFGFTRRCEAWYQVTQVLRKPPDLPIEAGDKLWLRYNCDENRAYEAGDASPIAWAQPGFSDYLADVWLPGEAVERDRAGVWSIPNPDNRLTPVASGKF